jgi:hypothetical protein
MMMHFQLQADERAAAGRHEIDDEHDTRREVDIHRPRR